MCPNQLYTISASGTGTFEWRLYADAYILSGQGTNSIYVQTNSSYNGGSVQVRTNNGCAWSAVSGALLPDASSCYSALMAEENVFNIYPNPASSDFTIEWPDSINVSSVDMLDETNKIQKKVKPKTKDKKVIINVSDLKEDQYYLHIVVGEAIIRKRILVKR